MREFTSIYGPGTEYCSTDQRAKIWEHFTRSTQMLRDTVPIAAAWVGGSFVTAKPVPTDIDVVYILDTNKYSNLDGEAKSRVTIFATDGALFEKGILVDSHVLAWKPHGSLDPDNPAHHDYLKYRGYWDDFFQRYAEDKLAPLEDRNAIPVRGYLEVILDGFDA